MCCLLVDFSFTFNHSFFVLAFCLFSKANSISLSAISFLKLFLATALTKTAPGTLLYVFMDWRHLFEMLTAARALDLRLINICVWNKSNAGMGSLYRSKHELVFVYRVGSASHLNNVELGRNGRNRTNVWAYPGANSFLRSSEEADLLAQHPTPKPVALVADAIVRNAGRS